MTNEPPREVWFASGFLASFIRYKDAQVRSGKQEGYNHYILSTRVEKMIRLAVLERRYYDVVSGLLNLPCSVKELEIEIDTLREELQ